MVKILKFLRVVFFLLTIGGPIFVGYLVSIYSVAVYEGDTLGQAIIFLVPGSALISFVVLQSILKSINRSTRKYCLKCGSSMKGAAFEVVQVDSRESSAGDVVVKMEFKAECPKCKKEKVFKQSFLAYQEARHDSTGRRTSSPKTINVQRKIDKLTRRYFGS